MAETNSAPGGPTTTTTATPATATSDAGGPPYALTNMRALILVAQIVGRAFGVGVPFFIHERMKLEAQASNTSKAEESERNVA